MKKLLLSALLGVSLISSVFAMDIQELMITKDHIDFDGGKFIEFKSLLGYANKTDAQNRLNGTKIGIACKDDYLSGEYRIIEDKFKNNAWWINSECMPGVIKDLIQEKIYPYDVEYKVQFNANQINKIFQDFEQLQKTEKFEFLNGMKKIIEEKMSLPQNERAYSVSCHSKWTIAAIDYLIKCLGLHENFLTEEKIILGLCQTRFIQMKNDKVRCVDNSTFEKLKDGIKLYGAMVTSPIWLPIGFWKNIFEYPKVTISDLRDYLKGELKPDSKASHCRFDKWSTLAALTFTVLDIATLTALGFAIKKRIQSKKPPVIPN